MNAKLQPNAARRDQRFSMNPRLWGKARISHKRHFGKNIFRLGTVNSTQDVLKELFLNGAPEGTIVAAEDQIRGRGRRERPWHSMSGKSLCVSLLLLPEGSEDCWTWVPLWAGIAVRSAVADLVKPGLALDPQRVKLKWPNDVMLDDRKLGGILAERVLDGSGRAAVLLGMGINLLHAKDDFPPHLRTIATSLFLATGEAYFPDAMLEKVVISFEEHYSLIKPVNIPRIKNCWLEQAWGFNARLRITSNESVQEGAFTDLGRHGEICLQNGENHFVRLASVENIEWISSP